MSYVGSKFAIAFLLPGFIASLTFVARSAAQNPAASQTSSKSLATGRVQQVIVRGTGDATEIEIQTSGATAPPNTQAITGPDRIIVDFPGTLPADEVRALSLKLTSGALKGIRAGLFFNNPPVTRIVLDLSQPQSYHILTMQNAIVLKLGPANLESAKISSPDVASPKIVPAVPTKSIFSARAPVAESKSAAPNPSESTPPEIQIVRVPRLRNASLASSTHVATAKVPDVGAPRIALVPPPPPPPLVSVSYISGMLRIRAEKATLAQVLYEVQLQTHAEIAIPAGAEQEVVISDLGPGSARDVLSALLNGSPYNFIFVGNESTLEQVILTRRDPNNF